VTAFTFALFMGALCFWLCGYYSRAWVERGRRDNARPGYLEWNLTARPYDQQTDRELERLADAMDVMHGSQTA
jgi:hypothetical protein